MLKSLTKEAFWNELYAKYPELMQEFCQWIDEYKKSVSWPDLIGSYIKYHDLPIGLQIGVFIQWTMERGSNENFMYGSTCESMEQFAAAVKDWFQAETNAMIDDLFDQAGADPDHSGLISFEGGKITVEKGSTLDKILSASPKNYDRTNCITCHECHGTGLDSAFTKERCKNCGGHGFLPMQESKSEPYPVFPPVSPPAIAKPVKGSDEESE